MYGLPLIKLKKLLSLRASEGFQVIDLRVNSLLSHSSRIGSDRRSRRGTQGVPFISDAKVLARLARYLSTGLTVEYMMEYEPLSATGGLGSVNICLEVVGPDEWMQTVRDVQGRRPDVIRQCLRKFCRALYEVDVVLCRVIGLLKSPQTADLGRDEARRRLSSGDKDMIEELFVAKDDTAVKFRDLLWLGRMSVHEWRRWLWVEYFEVLGKIEGPDGTMIPREDSAMEEEEEEEEEEADIEDSPSVVLDEVLTAYATQRANRHLYWKLFRVDDDADKSENTSHTFCVINVTWATTRLLGIHVGFFGISGTSVSRHLKELQEEILSTGGGSVFSILDSRVAFQLILPPESPPANPEIVVKPKVFFRHRLQNAHQLLTSYLQCRRWIWNLGTHLHLPVITSILVHTKKEEGFVLVEPLDEKISALLLRRISIPVDPEEERSFGQSQQNRVTLVQYRVTQDTVPNRLRTELWIEPQYGYHPLFESLATAIHQQDRSILSSFHSFYCLRRLCRASRLSVESGMEEMGCVSDGMPLSVLDLVGGATPKELSLKLFMPGPDDEIFSPGEVTPVAESEDGDDPSVNLVTSINAHLHQMTEQTLMAALGAEVRIADITQAEELLINNPALAASCDVETLVDSKVFAHIVGKEDLTLWFLLPPRPKATKLSLLVFIITEAQLLWRFVNDDSRSFAAVPTSMDDNAYGRGSTPPLRRSPVASDPWEATSMCMDHIVYMHRRNFTQAAYQALRSTGGRGMAAEDLKDALSYCSEFGIDVDVTQLRKISLSAASAVAKELAEDTSGTSSKSKERRGSQPMRRKAKSSPDLPTPVELDSATFNGDRDFVKKLMHYLTPVPGTDYFFFTGSDQDLLESDTITDNLGAFEEWGHGIPGLSSSTYHVDEPHVPEVAGGIPDDPPSIYLRRESGMSFGKATPAGVPADLGQADVLDISNKGVMIDASVSKDMSAMDNGSEFCCFVRFELAHVVPSGVEGDQGSNRRSFPLTASKPPGEALLISLVDGLSDEDLWSSPQTSRQLTSISIICATHSRLESVKVDMALAMGGAAATAPRINMKDAILLTNKRFLGLMRRQIEAWAAGEILNSLLSLHPLPEESFSVILQSLRPLPPDALTKFSIDLAFVTDLPTDSSNDSKGTHGAGGGGSASQGSATGSSDRENARGDSQPNQRKESQEAVAILMFQDQLSSGAFLPVRKIHDVYFVMEPGDASLHPRVPGRSNSYRTLPRASSHEISEDDTRIRYWAILQLRKRKSLPATQSASTVPLSFAAGASAMEGQFCFLSSYTVHVALHHPHGTVWYDQRQDIMNRIREGIMETCAHVNKLLLLAHLHDTRLASPLLIAPTAEDLR